MSIGELLYKDFDASFRIFIWGLVAAIFFTFTPIEYGFPFLVLFFGMILGILIILVECPEEFNDVLFLFIAGLLIRVLVSVLLYFFLSDMHINEGFFVGDGLGFSLNGWRISRLWELGLNVNISNFVSNFGTLTGAISHYDFLNAIIYSIAGYSPLSLFFINCVSGSLSIVIIFIISYRLFGREVALLSSMFCAFVPSFIIWSSQNLKDPLANLATLICLYLFIKSCRHIKVSSIVFLSLMFAGLYYLRILVITPLLLSLFLYLLFAWKIKLRVKLIFIVISGLFLFNYFPLSDFFVDSLKEIDSNRTVRAYGNLAYFPDFRISSIAGFLVYLPLGLIAVWFLPFPWQASSFNQIFVLPEVIIYYLLLPFTVKGIYLTIKKGIRDSHLLIATLFIFSIFLAVYEGNLGTLYRHKAVVMMLLFIFTSIGLKFKGKSNSVSNFPKGNI